MTNRLRLYLAGPITGDGREATMQANVAHAFRVGRDIAAEGVWTPFIPHSDWYWPDRDVFDHGDYMDMDLPWVRASGALYRIPGVSPGADLEVRVARRHSIPCAFDLEQLDVIAQQLLRARRSAA
jgi:hypothetical protein